MGTHINFSRLPRAKFIRVLFVFLFLCTPLIQADPSYSVGSNFSPETVRKLNRNISLDLRGVQVIDVLKYLAEKSELNIVASQALDGRVTLLLKEVSIGNALDIILLSTGLAFREKEGIFYIMTDAEYTSLYGEPYRDQRHMKILQIKYADPSKIGEILAGVKSAVGKVVVDKLSGTVILIDTPEKIKIMEETISSVDIATVQRQLPTRTVAFEIQYNKAVEMDVKVQSLLTPGVGYSKVDEKSNTILVNDLEPGLKRIKELITAFDRKTREVFIEAKMIQVRLSNEYQMGINWDGILKTGNPGKNNFKAEALQTFPAQNISSQFGRYTFYDLGRSDVVATINLLHAFGDTRTIASPQLAAENNVEANILVGTREAYVTSTVSQASASTTTSEAITFVDVGVKLKVLSLINKDNYISMAISPEISSVGTTLTTSNGNVIPIVDTITASTRVLVKDGHTVLIGGLMKDEIVKKIKKLPMLGDVPFLGSAFRSTDDLVVKTELVLFLTPHIVEGDEPLPFSATASGKTFEGLKQV